MKNPHPECRISLNFKISFLTKSNFSRLSDGSKERFSKRVVIVDELNETKNLFFEVISDSSQDKFWSSIIKCNSK